MRLELRTFGAVDKAFGWKVLLSEIIWSLQVQSQLPVRITRNTYYELKLVPSNNSLNWNSLLQWFEKKCSVRDSVWPFEFGSLFCFTASRTFWDHVTPN